MPEVALQLDHFEVFFHGAAIGAAPVFGDIFPSGAGCQAIFRAAFVLLVDPTADQAHPGFVAFIVTHGTFPVVADEMGLALEYAA